MSQTSLLRLSRQPAWRVAALCGLVDLRQAERLLAALGREVPDLEAVDFFDAVEEVVLRLAVQASGTLSAEHGIGRAKAGWLGLMRGEAKLALMGRLKRAFDPAGLLSPGRVLPAAAGAAR